MKSIVFTSHAEERMNRDRISREEVVNALLNPDSIVQGYKNRFIAKKYRGKYVL